MNYVYLLREFDTLSYHTSHLFLPGICSPDVSCFEFSMFIPWQAQGVVVDFTAKDHGYCMCLTCLRTWAFPQWGRSAMSNQSLTIVGVCDPVIQAVPAVNLHMTCSVVDPPPVSQIAAINWYGGIFPEVFLKIFTSFPELFPETLHPQMPIFLRQGLANAAAQRHKCLFMHAGIHAYSDNLFDDPWVVKEGMLREPRVKRVDLPYLYLGHFVPLWCKARRKFTDGGPRQYEDVV